MGESTSSSTYPVEAYSEEQSTSVYPFPAVTLSAIQVQNAGAWGGMTTAASYGSAYGVQGYLQNSNLPKNELIVGGSLPILPGGTKLWSSATASTSASTLVSTSASTLKVSSTVSSSTSSSSSTTYIPPTLTVTNTQTVTSTLPASTTTVTSTLPANTTTTTITATTPVNSSVETVVATETFCVQGNPATGVACSGANGPLGQRGGPSLTSVGVGGLLLAGVGAGALILNRRRSRNRTRTRIQSA